MQKEVREIAREIRERGFIVDDSGKGYPKVKTADGKVIATLPKTPGRGRWKQNLLAELKRKGVL